MYTVTKKNSENRISPPQKKDTRHENNKADTSPLCLVAERFMNFCNNYRPFFNVARHNVSDKARCYAMGLMMTAQRKNMERMEEYVPDYNYQAQQQFISNSPWDDEGLRTQVGQDVNELISGEDTAFIIDESCFGKKGDKSAGVSRQWNGRLGKTDNCQVGVYAALSNGKKSSLVDERLYLPKSWTDDEKRCKAAGIPVENQQFRTKTELALDMIDASIAHNLNYGWVGLDGGYGKCPWLLRAIADRGIAFVADVHSNQIMYPYDPAPYLPEKKTSHGKKPSKLRTDETGIKVKNHFADLPDKSWKKIKLETQTRGRVTVYAASQRAWFWDSKEGTARQWWVVCVKDKHEKKWFVSNFSEDESLESLVRKQSVRYWIERAFQDAKTSVGMADYQVRGWKAWHHHMSMVMLGMLFMLKERIFNREKIELLSCPDIIELLNLYLPRADATEEEVIQNMQRRHRKRRKAIEAARQKTRQKEIFETETRAAT